MVPSWENVVGREPLRSFVRNRLLRLAARDAGRAVVDERGGRAGQPPTGQARHGRNHQRLCAAPRSGGLPPCVARNTQPADPQQASRASHHPMKAYRDLLHGLTYPASCLGRGRVGAATSRGTPSPAGRARDARRAPPSLAMASYTDRAEPCWRCARSPEASEMSTMVEGLIRQSGKPRARQKSHR